MRIIYGQPLSFGETGTEGILWSVQNNPKNKPWSYDDLHCLNNGNYLIIMNKRNKVIWHGEIKQETDPKELLANYNNMPHPSWIGRWYQKGEDASWGKMFNPKNHAVLICKSIPACFSKTT